MIQKYLITTAPMKTKGTIDFEKNIARVLIKMIEDLKLNNPKRITYETGYKIVEYYKATKRNRNNSINRYTNYLKRVMIYYDIRTSFLDFPKLKPDTVPFKRLNNQELRAIIHYLRDLNDTKNSTVYKTLIFLLLDSGMRIAEVLNVRIADIDINRKLIQIRSTKNHKTRYVPFSDFSKYDILEMMNKGRKRSLLFWNLLHDRELSKEDVRQFFKRLSRKLNIENIHAHRFRKTFASKLRENGARLEAIQYLLGHSRLATTMIYVEQKLDMTLEEYHNYNQWLA